MVVRYALQRLKDRLNIRLEQRLDVFCLSFFANCGKRASAHLCGITGLAAP